MIEVNKRDYKRALQWGFVPQNRVVHKRAIGRIPKEAGRIKKTRQFAE